MSLAYTDFQTFSIAPAATRATLRQALVDAGKTISLRKPVRVRLTVDTDGVTVGAVGSDEFAINNDVIYDYDGLPAPLDNLAVKGDAVKLLFVEIFYTGNLPT